MIDFFGSTCFLRFLSFSILSIVCAWLEHRGITLAQELEVDKARLQDELYDEDEDYGAWLLGSHNEVFQKMADDAKKFVLRCCFHVFSLAFGCRNGTSGDFLKRTKAFVNKARSKKSKERPKVSA